MAFLCSFLEDFNCAPEVGRSHTAQHLPIKPWANRHWQEINNHILLNKYGGWLRAILFREDKRKTESASQRSPNAFGKLWVSWWDRCKGTKLLERSPWAKPPPLAPKESKLQCRDKPREGEVTMNSPHCDWPPRLQNLSTWLQHGSDMPGKRHLIAHQEKKGGWKDCCRQSKVGLIYDVWWSLSEAGKQWGDVELTK